LSDNAANEDRFEAAYTTGIVEEPVEAPAVVEEAVGPPREMLAAQEPFALRGCVLAPTRKIEGGYVVVEADGIADIGEGEPDGPVRVIDTGGVILPGLIDLHGHPEYDVFSAWEPPQRYENRYRWRASEVYARVIKDPWHELTSPPSLLRTLTRYAEARALVGGLTAIQGASAKYPSKEEALVRNVDLPIFGRDRARSMIDLRSEEDAENVRAELESGEISVFYIHLAEGVDDSSRAELDKLEGFGLLREETVIIHGTALTDEQLGRVREAGAKLVWSPQSNLRLYGQTTRAAPRHFARHPRGAGLRLAPQRQPEPAGRTEGSPPRTPDARRISDAQTAGGDGHQGSCAHRRAPRVRGDLGGGQGSRRLGPRAPPRGPLGVGLTRFRGSSENLMNRVQAPAE
jgi:5-methylthioadenosine/S-adenosylhomocysteine deaminase